MTQIATGKLIQTMAAFARVKQVVGNHGITGYAPQGDTRVLQHQLLVFDILIHLADGRILKNRLQVSQHLFGIQTGVTRWTPQCHIMGHTCPRAQGDTNDPRLQWIQTRGFQVKGKPFPSQHFRQKQAPLFRGCHRLVAGIIPGVQGLICSDSRSVLVRIGFRRPRNRRRGAEQVTLNPRPRTDRPGGHAAGGTGAGSPGG